MTEEEFINWIEGISTPQVLTDELRNEIISNFEDAYNTAFNKGEMQGRDTVIKEILN